MQPLIILTTLLIIFTAFIVFIIRKVGVLPSISDSFYKLGKYGGLLFWLVLASMAGFMVLLDKQNPYLIISAAGLLFTCGSPYFEIEYPDKPIHFVGAATAILSAFANLYVTYGFWLFVVKSKRIRRVILLTW